MATTEKLFATRMAVGRMAYDMGYFGQAVRHFHTALELAGKENLPAPSLADANLSLGKAYACQGRYKEAEEYLTKALNLDAAEADRPRSIEQAMDYIELALLYSKTARKEQAIDYNKRAISLLDKLKTSPVEQKAKALKQLALIYCEEQEYEEAMAHISIAVDALEKAGGLKQTLIYGECLMVKSIVLVELGDIDSAREIYYTAMQTIELNRGPFHPKVANMMDMFSEMTAQAGRTKASEILAKKASKIRKVISRQEQNSID
jgi:tetratricopeptide (TPR) repeat protein